MCSFHCFSSLAVPCHPKISDCLLILSFSILPCSQNFSRNIYMGHSNVTMWNIIDIDTITFSNLWDWPAQPDELQMFWPKLPSAPDSLDKGRWELSKTFETRLGNPVLDYCEGSLSILSTSACDGSRNIVTDLRLNWFFPLFSDNYLGPDFLHSQEILKFHFTFDSQQGQFDDFVISRPVQSSGLFFSPLEECCSQFH